MPHNSYRGACNILQGSSTYRYSRHSQNLEVVAAALTHKNVAGLVKSRPLAGWKETLAILTSYSSGDEWAGLCDALARRLANAGNSHAATLAWICAGDVESTIRVWVKGLQAEGVTVTGLQVRQLGVWWWCPILEGWEGGW